MTRFLRPMLYKTPKAKYTRNQRQRYQITRYKPFILGAAAPPRHLAAGRPREHGARGAAAGNGGYLTRCTEPTGRQQQAAAQRHGEPGTPQPRAAAAALPPFRDTRAPPCARGGASRGSGRGNSARPAGSGGSAEHGAAPAPPAEPGQRRLPGEGSVWYSRLTQQCKNHCPDSRDHRLTFPRGKRGLENAGLQRLGRLFLERV